MVEMKGRKYTGVPQTIRKPKFKGLAWMSQLIVHYAKVQL